MRKLLHLSVVLALLSVVSLVYASSFGPPAGSTGAPGEGTCADAGCHDDFPVNSGPGALTVSDIPITWNGDFRITTELSQAGMIRWGFQASVLDSDGQPVESVVIVDSARTIMSGTPSHPYISHNSLGTDSGVVDVAPGWNYWWYRSWPWDWADTSHYFYTAAVAANGDGTPAGDYVYLSVYKFYPYINECPLLGIMTGDVTNNGSLTSADVIYLVSFVIRGGDPLPYCDAVGDVNCDNTVTSADIISLVNYVFKGGWPPCDPCSVFGPLEINCS